MVKVRLKLNVVHVLQQLTATRQKREPMQVPC